MNWITLQNCEVLSLDGVMELNDKAEKVITAIKNQI